LWWLLAALVVALGVGIPLFVRARRRRAWDEDLVAATTEVAWIARDLIPQLEQVPSPEQAAGGWHVANERVSAAEDRLTALETSAPGEQRAIKARTLRDAVREARRRVDELLASGLPNELAAGLPAVVSGLEAAITPTSATRSGVGP
jgi:hypothetical protein